MTTAFPSPLDAPVMDRSFVEELEAHLGHAEVAEMVADGMFDILDRIGRLAELADADDAGGVLSVAHSLAGAAGNLGLARISALASLLERTVTSAGLEDARVFVTAIGAQRDPALDAMADYIRPALPDLAATLASRMRA